MCGICAVFGYTGNFQSIWNAAHKISYRGPDAFRIETLHFFPSCCLAFHRLSIMDDLLGMQPMRVFRHPHVWLIFNGEIYNFQRLQKEFKFENATRCDSEIIIHLYAEGGIEFAAKHLDGTFAFCLLDTEKRKVHLARDSFGVRPLFRLYKSNGLLGISSEAKGLMGFINSNDEEVVQPFLPGHVETYHLSADGSATLERSVRFHRIGDAPLYSTCVDIDDNRPMEQNIRILFEDAVRKRMMAERRIGCLISGGVDSSLVASMVVKLAKEFKLPYKIQTFVVGMENSTDLLAAKKVADQLGTEHHELIFKPEEAIAAIGDVCYHLESYDTIVIRGSIPMYLLMKYIRENTDTTVVFSGEGSDELAQGYICYHKAPSDEEAEKASRRQLEDLYLYDVLRVDRCTAAWGLEIRVPFLDHKFSSYYLSLPIELRRPIKGIEKYTLRSAFASLNLIPDKILWRPKEGFSDGVSSTSRSWYEILTEYFDQKVEYSELTKAGQDYKFNPPNTKEALFYRRLFEKDYKGHGHFVPYFWRPLWSSGTEPSSRTLKYYKQ